MTRFDPTKPVQTRDGRKVRILCTDKVGIYPIVAIIEKGDGAEEAVETFTSEGREYVSREMRNDLVNVPETETHYFADGDSYRNFKAANDRYDGSYAVFKVVTDKATGAVISAERASA